MSSVYQRGNRLWCSLKDERGKWIKKPTPYAVGQERDAERYVKRRQENIDARRAVGDAGPMTVKRYAAKWIKERRELGIRSASDEEARLEKHALPHIGSLRLADVRPIHIRDMVRELRKADTLAPRTILHVYGTVRTMFGNAEGDELIAANPCKLKRGDKPPKVDADPEWRGEATYTIAEVERMISDDTIPVERRVQYALKALAGLRHGEVAGLRWRHYDAAMEPLGRIVVATSYDTGRTKTEVARRVPVHPALAKVLAAWKLAHWERIYGRAPTAEDLIVGTRTMQPVGKSEAATTIKVDLAALGLRVEAGTGGRSRGGHDLRSWFITTCQEHGAHRDLLRVITHTSKGDVMSGYTRATWGALCGEVAKLRISAEARGEVLAFSTVLCTAERKARGRWGKVVTRPGIERKEASTSPVEMSASPDDRSAPSDRGRPTRTTGVERLSTAAVELASAVLAGDHERASLLAAELAGGVASYAHARTGS